VHCATIPELRAAADPLGRCLADPRIELDNSQFAQAVGNVAAGLAADGIGHGDVVAVMLPNRAEMVVAMFASWTLGAAMTPINPVLTAGEVGYQLADSGAKLLIADPDSVAGSAPSSARLRPVDELLAPSNAARPAAEHRMDDLALLVYTSGTTGRPKGVMLDHANLDAMSGMLIAVLELSLADRCLLILPLFHVNGLMVSVVSVLRAGGSTVIAPQFAADSFWHQVEMHQPTFFSAVPTICQKLTSLPEKVHPDVSSLRFVIVGAAPAAPQLIESFETRFGVPLLEGYGLSECTVAATLNPLRGPRKPGSVGVALPGQQVRIVNEQGQPVPGGVSGEVTVKGPNVMRGYLGKPEETSKTITGSWLHTGDVGRMDTEGYLTLVDRAKDMIIRAGENIYPKEIENVLYAHPDVTEAAVVGRPHQTYGEEPVAFVVIRPGADTSATELITHCKQSLAWFKVPREMYLEPSLPKNSVGKIIKGPLRDRAGASRGSAPKAPA
jgi:long-chain acyl-CoA synthetase